MNGLACLLIVVFVVIFCFPFTLPATAGTMNYASSMSCSLSLFVAAFLVLAQEGVRRPSSFPRLHPDGLRGASAIPWRDA